jgi:hypothetical protein
MSARPAVVHPAQAADLISRAVGVVGLGALAMIHLIDLPDTLSPLPLVGSGYLAIIAAAVVIGAVMIARSHWLIWAAAGAVAGSAMGGYILTRSLSGGFLGDHGDVGNWDCALGIASLTVEAALILLAAWRLWDWAGRTTPQEQPPARREPALSEFVELHDLSDVSDLG